MEFRYTSKSLNWLRRIFLTGFFLSVAPVQALASDGHSRKVFVATENGIPKIRTLNGEGSGVVLNADGVVITNSHVVGLNSCKNISAEIHGKNFPCKKIIFRSPLPRNSNRCNGSIDLAIIQFEIPLSYISTIPLATSDPGTGEDIYAQGYPDGHRAFTRGVVARANIGWPDYFQHDAAGNPGSSGGPILNIRGQVVGLNTCGGGIALKNSVIRSILKQHDMSYSTAEIVLPPTPEVITQYVDRPVLVEVEKTKYVDRPVPVETTKYVDRPVRFEKARDVATTTFRRGIFSRFVSGSNGSLVVDQISESSQERESFYRSDLDASQWDIIGFRNASGFDFVVTSGTIGYRSSIGTRWMETSLNQIGLRLDYYPVQYYWNDWIGAQVYFGVGYCVADLHSIDQANKDYSYKLSGSGPTTAIGLDFYIGRFVGLAVAWNGFAVWLDRYSTSEKAAEEANSLSKELDREPIISGSNVGVGLTLNLPL